jgi:hypothetical protein
VPARSELEPLIIQEWLKRPLDKRTETDSASPRRANIVRFSLEQSGGPVCLEARIPMQSS